MGEFAKVANALLAAPAEEAAPADWQSRLAGQKQRMSKLMPSTEDETSQKALSTIEHWRDMAFKIGYGLRSQRHAASAAANADLPVSTGREIAIRLPHTEKTAFLGAITDPIEYKLQDIKAGLKQKMDEKRQDLTRVTSDPATLPWYYPAMALNLPKAFIEGYQKADSDLETSQSTAMDSKLQAARKSFEQALADEYSSARKTASAGAFVDGLAQAFTKAGSGELNTATGVYLALASLLGYGAHTAAKSWVEKNDPRYQRARAVKELVSQRMRAVPPPVLVSASDNPPSEELEGVPGV